MAPEPLPGTLGWPPKTAAATATTEKGDRAQKEDDDWVQVRVRVQVQVLQCMMDGMDSMGARLAVDWTCWLPAQLAMGRRVVITDQ